MMQEKLKEIRDLLTEVKYPGTSKNIVELDMVQNIRICGMLWKSFSLMMLPCSLNRKLLSLWALDSAAVSWDFFIWRSSRKDWRENITWIWSQLLPELFIKCIRQMEK